MESQLDQTGGFSLRLTCVLDGIASSMLSTSLTKALSFRAGELGLRMPQQSVDVIIQERFHDARGADGGFSCPSSGGGDRGGDSDFASLPTR